MSSKDLSGDFDICNFSRSDVFRSRAVALFIIVCVMLVGCSESEPDYVTAKNTRGLAETKVLFVNDFNSYEQLSGRKTQNLREEDPELLKKLRLSNMGKFTGIEVTEPELVDWAMFDGAYVRGLDIKGKSVPPEAWKWLKTLKGFGLDQTLSFKGEAYDPPRYGDDLSLELENQEFDEVFYDGLFEFLEPRKLNGFRLTNEKFDFCRLPINRLFDFADLPSNSTQLPVEAIVRKGGIGRLEAGALIYRNPKINVLSAVGSGLDQIYELNCKGKD